MQLDDLLFSLFRHAETILGIHVEQQDGNDGNANMYPMD